MATNTEVYGPAWVHLCALLGVHPDMPLEMEFTEQGDALQVHVLLTVPGIDMGEVHALLHRASAYAEARQEVAR